jgi:hypothetical protein
MTKAENLLIEKIRAGSREAEIEFGDKYTPFVDRIVEKSDFSFLIDKNGLRVLVIKNAIEIIKTRRIKKSVVDRLYKITIILLKSNISEIEYSIAERIYREDSEENQKVPCNPRIYKEFMSLYTGFAHGVIDRERYRFECKHGFSPTLKCGDDKIAEATLKEIFRYLSKNALQKSLAGLVKTATVRKFYRCFQNQSLGPDVSPDPPGPEDELLKKERRKLRKLCFQMLDECLDVLTKTQFLVVSLWTECYFWSEIARLRRVSPAAITAVKDAAFLRLQPCIRDRIRKCGYPRNTCDDILADE